MIDIFHVSDLHFGKSEGTERSKKLLTKINEIFKITSSVNKYLLVTGNITEAGEPSQYKIALNALSLFRGKIYFVPGNHDYGTIGFIYTQERAKYFDEKFASELDKEQLFFSKDPFIKLLSENETNRIFLIGLNSCFKRPEKKPLGESLGIIGYHQMLKLDTFLKSDESKNAKKIVYLHHIPHQPAKDYWMDLLDYDDLMNVIKDKVNALAFGHSGKMPPIKNKKLKERLISLRKMELIDHPSGVGVDYILDAYQSVEDFSCYHIKVENSEITSVEKEPLPLDKK